MMPHPGWPSLATALLVSLTLAGCRSTLGTNFVDIGPGHGRVDRSFPTGINPTIRAMLESLDELGVRPRALTVRTMGTDPSDQAALRVTPIPATNADLLAGKLFHDLLTLRATDRVQAGGQAASIPGEPVLLSYKGQTADGRELLVIVRAAELDIRRDAGTLVMARVGVDGDEGWGQQLMEKVTAKLPGRPAQPTPSPPTPPK